MAYLYIKEILVVFVAWIAHGQVKSWLRNRELKRWSDENGCGELPKVPNELPYGLERAWKLITGMKGSFDVFYLWKTLSDGGE